MSDRKPNDRLKAMLAEAAWSYAELARSVRSAAAEAGVTLRTNSSAVTHWIAGTRPNDHTIGVLTEVFSRRLGRVVAPDDVGFPVGAGTGADNDLGLSLSADPVVTLSRLGEVELQRRSFFATAAYSVAAAALPLSTSHDLIGRGLKARAGGRVGSCEILAVREMTQLLTQIDERHGGHHGRAAVVQYLITDVAALCQGRFATEDQHRQMLSAAACTTYLAGWKAYDAGKHSLAQRYYMQAYSLAIQARDSVQAAFVLRVMAHNGIDLERPEHTVNLADRAWEMVKHSASPRTRSLYRIAQARTAGYAKRPHSARQQMDAAWTELGSGEEDELPFHAQLWGSAEASVSSHTAKTLTLLHDFEAAEQSYRRAAARRMSAGKTRIAGLSLASTAKMQFRQGNVEQACWTWNDALDLLDGVRSARARSAVNGINQSLQNPRFRTVQPVCDLLGRIQQTT